MKLQLSKIQSFILALFTFATVGEANAGIISSATPDGAGGFTYTYQVDNQVGAFPVSAWSLEFPGSPDWDSFDVAFGGGVTVPPGWAAGPGIPVLGVTAQDFYSLSSLSDVLPGGILGDFSFTSTFAPTDVTFLLYGSGGEVFVGQALGPAVSPTICMPDNGPGWSISLLVMLAVLGTGRRPSS